MLVSWSITRTKTGKKQLFQSAIHRYGFPDYNSTSSRPTKTQQDHWKKKNFDFHDFKLN